MSNRIHLKGVFNTLTVIIYYQDKTRTAGFVCSPGGSMVDSEIKVFYTLN